MINCAICHKHQHTNKEELLVFDGNWVLSHGQLQSDLLGYFYLEPRRHVEHWSEFNTDELVQMGPLIKQVESALSKEIDVQRLYTVIISEAVRHIHIHLIPRTADTETKGISLIQQATSPNPERACSLTTEKIRCFMKRIKKHLDDQPLVKGEELI